MKRNSPTLSARAKELNKAKKIYQRNRRDQQKKAQASREQCLNEEPPKPSKRVKMNHRMKNISLTEGQVSAVLDKGKGNL